jgi:sporulation protein YlmC with PRC-barrel domain
MPETTRFRIGTEVTGTDGSCGELERVVIDPVAMAVTHLVVVPKHRGEIGRLVPLELVDMTTTGELGLTCTVGEFETIDRVEETHFLPGGGSYGGYESGHVLPWPHYALGNPMGMGMASAIGLGSGEASQRVTYDTVSLDEVQVRRGDQVHASDGDIGKVQGLVIDPRNHQVTHVLLQEGHLWGRKQVAIPISAVSLSGAEGIGLKISKDDVRDLPEVPIDATG